MSAFALQLKAALAGDYEKELAEGLNAAQKALQLALFQTAGELRSKLVQDVSQSRLGARVAKTWRQRNYKNTGLNPAALVYSNFPKVIAAFESGALIKSESGFYLTIPNPAVWGRSHVARSRRGTATLLSIAEARFGKLRFVFVKGRRDLGLLVADVRKGTGKRGGYRKLSDRARAKGDFSEQVVFFLVKQARIPKLLHGDVIRARAHRDTDARVAQLFEKYFDQGAQPQLQLTGPSE